MCGIIGAWAPPDDAEGALAGLALSRGLEEARARRAARGGAGARLLGRWAWGAAQGGDGVARWAEVGEALGPSLGAALRALAHRGPDGAGFYLSPCGGLWLAHTRLAVRGARGAQPIGASPRLGAWSAEPTPLAASLVEDRAPCALWAAVNGELYGAAPLGAPHDLSDAALLLDSYERDPLLPPRPAAGEAHAGLRGEYSFALWDEGRARLLLGRDPFGVKPLCYAWRAGRLYFASEAKALFALGAVEPAWARGALAQTLLCQYLTPAQTLFEGVRLLPPGGALRLEGGRAPQLSAPALDALYPTPEEPAEGHAGESAGEGAGELRAALLDATALRLGADVPTCFQLSGGLDSSAVLGAARALGVERPWAFSLAFDDPRYDESAAARETARALGARWERVDASSPRLLGALSDAVYHAEGLCINGQLPAKRLLCLAMRDAGARVCLSGEGADEALLGYPHLARDAHPHAADALAARQPQTAAVMLGGALTPLPALEEAWGYTPSFLSAKRALLAPLRGLFEGDGAALGAGRLDEESPLWAALPGALGLHGRAATPLARARRSAWAWARLCLAGYILKGIGDGMEMSASVEGRPVYLDPLLFGLAARLARVAPGAEKGPLRDAARGLIPEAARLAPKRSLLSPPLGLPRAGEEGALERALAVSAAEWAAIPALSPSLARAWLEGLRRAPEEERARQDPALCALLSLHELHRRLLRPAPAHTTSPR